MDQITGGQLQRYASAEELIETSRERDTGPRGVVRAWIHRQFGDLLARCGLLSDFPFE